MRCQGKHTYVKKKKKKIKACVLHAIMAFALVKVFSNT